MSRARLGIAETTYSLRGKAGAGSAKLPGFREALDLLRHCSELGAGGGQVSVHGWDRAYAAKVRALAERTGMYVEGQIALPRDEGDRARFETELSALREAGGAVARTVLHGGRRYEVFESADAFAAWREHAWQSLRLAEPIARRLDVKLAVENHKDVRVPELLGMVTRLDSPAVGVCLDTGNSIALLEDPMEVVEALAPRAFACHLKDMGVAPAEDGFLLSEVPLGEGFLDLAAIVRHIRAANPRIAFSLEMITRDPLRVPCLNDRYWATLRDVPARDLARTLAMVKKHTAARLPAIHGLDAAGALALEEQHVERCLAFAAAKLGL